MTLPIRVVEHRDPFTFEWLEQQYAGSIIACDFYISGAELGTRVPGGYSRGRIVNIDHHADDNDMKRFVSSANLARDRIAAEGVPNVGTVLISHADCDSVLSSGIMSGELPSDPALGDAAVAADHTGEADVIADVLQELENIRAIATRNLNSTEKVREKERDLPYCFDVIKRLLAQGESALDTRARAALAERRRKRADAADFVSGGGISMSGGVALGCPLEKLDGEFFPALIPDACIILLMTRRTDNPSLWDAKVRLGMAAPAGLDLKQLGASEIDVAFGGRWNAGSNTRNGGTSIDPETYASEISERLTRIFPSCG
jgi:hypothetical protein